MGKKSHRNQSSAGGDSNESPHAENLRAKWKHVVKKRPPALREAWLKTQEAISALGAKNVATILDALEKQARAVTQTACSESWMHAWMMEGIVPHGLSLVDTTLRRKDLGRRKYAVRLIKGTAKIQYGSSDGLPGDLPVALVGHRRWTPPNAFKVEDELDLMSTWNADLYWAPASPSAEAIRLIGAYGGHEIGANHPTRDRFVFQSQDADRRLRVPFVEDAVDD